MNIHPSVIGDRSIAETATSEPTNNQENFVLGTETINPVDATVATPPAGPGDRLHAAYYHTALSR